MIYRPLADTGIDVSALCLGTMTFGEQNDHAEAFEQLDMALDAGVNVIDTAEMYAIPPRAQTMGSSETIIGRWLAQRRCRDRVVIATKVCGPGRDWLTYIRGGDNHLDRANIQTAVDDSLRRLQTDVIDLYQLHWPERRTNCFGNSVTAMSTSTSACRCCTRCRHSAIWSRPARSGTSVCPTRHPGG